MSRITSISLSCLPLLVLGLATLSPAGCKRDPGKATGKGISSNLADAGKGMCDPSNHEKPFIIEWDATDMSSFESYAANDMVMVHYEGCSLRVVDTCRDDDISGKFGTYKPVEWTSGSLEALNIADENTLYAKLPLGQATLGGRVRSGEKFKMEYFVAGTRTATRSKVYTGDLSQVDGCEDVTHFVYAYNLGAFALGSVQNLEADAKVSVFGFGGGAEKKSSRQADKKGGDLGTCKSDSATEISGCKVPIRLNLRKLTDGDNPKEEEDRVEDTDASLNAAAALEAKLDLKGEAGERVQSAMRHMNAGDGQKCLAELDKHDKLEPKKKSTDPSSGLGIYRSSCLMISGKCKAGKELLRKTYEKMQNAAFSTPEQIDRGVEAQASMYCQGGDMSKRDKVLAAIQDLTQGAYMGKKDKAFCMKAYKTIRDLGPKIKPKDEDDNQISGTLKALFNTAATCFVKADECKSGLKVYIEAFPPVATEHFKTEKEKNDFLKEQFLKDNTFKRCKGKL